MAERDDEPVGAEPQPDPDPEPNPQQPAAEPAGTAPEGPKAPSVLRLVWPLAVFALVATVFGRAFAPSVVGVVVGLDRVVGAIDRVASVFAQALAMSSEVVAIAAILAVASARARAPVRLGAIVLGGFVVMVSLSAAGSTSRLSPLTCELLGGAAVLVAFAGAVASRRVPFAQPVARAVATIAVGGALRLGAVAFALADPRFAALARALATAALLADAAAMILAMNFASRRARSLFDPLTAVALVCALLATRAALSGDQDDAPAFGVLMRRAADVLVAHPRALGPPALATFVAFLAPLLAVGALVRGGPLPALAGALVLALLARGAADLPLSALGLAVSGLALALIGSDPRAVWTSIAPARVNPPPRADPDGASG